ncbi:hypothetical protein [Aminobacter sp. AP02]|uniref:hypothetical protein n=1 Tax=Aminobacter sp. AP02 TaxID=2135737 RepID=UPI000D7AF1CA|nr:hypothetical protein [Aminobacter sp. AP02]PWK64632.1 hypothetical protein C8K44_11973 [Aminobacter sp. AP02]
MTSHHRRPGRPLHGGSPEAAAASRQRRREDYARLRAALSMSPAELARLLGLAESTVRILPAWSSASFAPSDRALDLMRQELLQRTKERLEEARIRREIERESDEAECREHLAYCGIIDPDDAIDGNLEDAA